jgi:hypothetical protein
LLSFFFTIIIFSFSFRWKKNEFACSLIHTDKKNSCRHCLRHVFPLEASDSSGGPSPEEESVRSIMFFLLNDERNMCREYVEAEEHGL